MKKVLILTLVLINMLSLLSCDIALQYEKEYDPHNFEQKREAVYTEETAMIILNCFDNKDADTLEGMFSETIKNEYNLKEQIEKAFEIYGGKSVSDVQFHFGGYAGSSSEDGIYVQKSVVGDIKDIKTDYNEEFIISLKKCVLDDYNPNKLGIEWLHLRDGDNHKLAIIGEVKPNEIKILEENNKKRNNGKSSGSD